MNRRDMMKAALAAGGGLGAGALLTGSTSTVSLTGKQAPVGQTFNVRTQGAKGDGLADDTIPVQEAIRAAVAARVGHVVFPAGTYRITRTLRIDASERLDITGDGASSILLHENDEPLLQWAENASCCESSVRHLCFTSANKHKSAGTAVIACSGGAERALFSHLLFNAMALPGGEPTRMGSGIVVDRVMDTTTLEHCLMWGPVWGTGIRIARGSEVRIIGGRILGSANPYVSVNPKSIGVHVTGNNGGVHVVTTDLIGLGTAIKIGEEGNGSNREIFLTHATIDSSHHGIVQVDAAYTSVTGCWAASCDEEQVLLTESAEGALLCVAGGSIFNGGTYGRPGGHHGLVARAGSFVLSGVMVRHNKGVGILVEGDRVKDYAITGCRISNNGRGAVLGGSGYAVTGNVFAGNGEGLREAVKGSGVVGSNAGA